MPSLASTKVPYACISHGRRGPVRGKQLSVHRRRNFVGGVLLDDTVAQVAVELTPQRAKEQDEPRQQRRRADDERGGAYRQQFAERRGAFHGGVFA